MVGCSNGGRHAFVGATRLAKEFDGFLAGAPGYNLPMVSLQHAWDLQSFEQAGGDIRKALSRDDMQTLADGVRQQCDALDGAADGIVGAIAACQKTFDIKKLALRARRRPGRASPTADRGARAFVRWPEGQERQGALYVVAVSTRAWASNDWRAWKLESPIPGFDGLPLIATLGAGSLAQVFTTPPTQARRHARGPRSSSCGTSTSTATRRRSWPRRRNTPCPRWTSWRRPTGATRSSPSSRPRAARSSSITARATARSRCRRRSTGTRRSARTTAATRAASRASIRCRA